jgi:hypothetical protein
MTLSLVQAIVTSRMLEYTGERKTGARLPLARLRH